VTFLDTDTEFLFALTSKRDAHHQRVVEVFGTFKGFVSPTTCSRPTTLSPRPSRWRARSAMLRPSGCEQLYGEKLARVHWASPDEERAAFDYFKRHQDQTYSFVDCLSFVVMEKLGIRVALAVDSDFTHRFIARPGPMRN
jgi:predicted nucleic acid-binding protein